MRSRSRSTRSTTPTTTACTGIFASLNSDRGGVALLHDEHFLANAHSDHVERDHFSALFAIVEIETPDEQQLLLTEVLVSVRRDDVANDAREIHESACARSRCRRRRRRGASVMSSARRRLATAMSTQSTLPDDAGVDRGERIVERQRRLARRDEVDDLARTDTDAVDGDDRLAGVGAGGGDRLDPLQGHRRQRVLLDRRDDATDDPGDLHGET